MREKTTGIELAQSEDAIALKKSNIQIKLIATRFGLLELEATSHAIPIL